MRNLTLIRLLMRHAPALLLCCICLLVVAIDGFTQQKVRLEDKRVEIETKIRESGAETVAVAVYDLESRHSLLINENVEMHAASTMKVPVMMEVFRLAAANKLKLGDRIAIRNSFSSVVDGSPYELDEKDDSASDFYQSQGETASIRELVDVMITRSSNLATNLLIDRVGANEVTALARQLGATTLKVRRGVEDGKAFRAGINNTTTARDLMVLLRALTEGKFFTPEHSDEMVDVLLRQEFNEALPAGVPDDVPVAHKTGSITKIKHDAGIVFPWDRRPYVIAVLVRGLSDETQSNALIANISRIVYEAFAAPASVRPKS